MATDIVQSNLAQLIEKWKEAEEYVNKLLTEILPSQEEIT